MITFGEESDSQKYAFDTDDLPSPNDRDSEKSASAYAKSFDIAMECAKQEKSLPEVLKKIHEVAIGEVNWKRTMAELESVEFANETDYTSGNFRPEMSSRLTIAHGRKGVVYDIPRVREATQLINELNTMLQDRIQVTQRVSDEYFELAAAVSLLTYISQPFLGGNKSYMGDGLLVNSGKFDGMDSEKAKKEIGYSQEISLEEGITRTCKWYKEVGWLK